MEVWKDITGYEGYYQISTHGRIRSVDRVVVRRGGQRQFRKGQIMKFTHNGNGYLVIGLNKSGKRKALAVHRLVAIHFVPNPMKRSDVNHINEDKHNNRIENLEWLTHKQNMNHGSVKHKISKAMRKSHRDRRQSA